MAQAAGGARQAANVTASARPGQPPNPAPVLTNTCYSFITANDVVHVASVHQYDAERKTLVAVQGAGGLSPGPTPLEGTYAFAWAKNIWSDMLG